MSEFQSLLTTLTPIASSLDAEHWGDLRNQVEQLEKNLQAVREEGRNLRIAIVGQMKAGKSSFLNAAFFGRDLLPKADTPMTAALTKICYAKEPRAQVVYYTEDDWEGIDAKAREYDARYREVEAELQEQARSSFGGQRPLTRHLIESRLGMDLRASKELVTKAAEAGLDVRRYLGKTETLPLEKGTEQIASRLQEYVGSGGRFTCITKMTELYVDDARFEGLEIYDTPGFNDPVVSRGQATRNFLGQCDVVFLLSRLSHFLESADLALLRTHLSEAGIDAKAVRLVGTQRDLALREDESISREARELATSYPAEKRQMAVVGFMIKLLNKRTTARVQSTLDQHLANPNLDPATRAVLSAVRQRDPLLISAWAWALAETWPNLNPDDQDQFDKLQRFTGFEFNSESLRQLSNIPAVREAVLEQRTYKDELTAGKAQRLVEGTRAGVRDKLDKLLSALDTRIQRVDSGDISRLQAQKRDAETRIEKGRAKLESVFESQIVRISQQFELLKTEVKARSHDHRNIQSRSETHTTSYEVSTSKWYKPWSWGSTETRYREVVTVYADAQDAIESLNRFALDSQRKLQLAIIDMINIEELRGRVASAAMALFDTGSADFDGELLLSEVQKSVGRLTIPSVEFGNKDYSAMVVKQFGRGRVSESSISGLREATATAVGAIVADLEAQVNSKTGEVRNQLERTCGSFVDKLVHDLREGLDTLCGQIANKEQVLADLKRARTVLDQCRNCSS